MKYYGKSLIPALSIPLLLSACHHKDLDYHEVAQFEPEIVFDWRDAPDADPASMAVYLFNETLDEPLLYEFSGRTGGKVRLPMGTYSGLATNSDNLDWARIRNRSSIEEMEVYTDEVNSLSVYGLQTHALPKAESEETERIVALPGMLWGARSDNMTYDSSKPKTQFIFYPHEAVCHYDVTIKDVENIEYLDGSAMDATLSGMSGSYRRGQDCPGDSKVTFPLVLTADKDDGSIKGNFLTFGECPSQSYSHILTVYLIVSDGSKRYYRFDVTDQISSAPDPKHVHIVVSRLKIPEPAVSGSGLIPNVDEWQTENVDIQM